MASLNGKQCDMYFKYSERTVLIVVNVDITVYGTGIIY